MRKVKQQDPGAAALNAAAMRFGLKAPLGRNDARDAGLTAAVWATERQIHEILWVVG